MAKSGSLGRLKWFLIILALAAGGGGVWYFTHPSDSTPQFQTANVTRGDIVQAVTATGTLNPVVNIQVGSQISGNIQKLFVDYNSIVKSNQVVAQLDPAIFQAYVAQAQGDLANAKANLELMQIEAKRADNLFASHLIAESDHDTAIANLHQATAMVQIKEAALSNAQVNLEHCTIYAPVDGIVISRNVDVGQTVAASLSAPTIFVIANDLTKMQIDANVSEADVGTVEIGQTVNFTVDAFPDSSFTGKVIQIRNSPITVQNVVTYDTVIAVNNPELKLKPGMTANVSIITAQRTGALKLPNAAFRFKPTDTLTNKIIAAVGEASKPAIIFTGKETPQELQKRVGEMRERGDEVPADIRNKLREFYKTGALKRPAGARGDSGSHTQTMLPTARTIYALGKDSSGDPVLKAVRVKTGIGDGIYTEVTDGLKEGDEIVIGVKSAGTQISSAPGVNSFMGGMSRRY